MNFVFQSWHLYVIQDIPNLRCNMVFTQAHEKDLQIWIAYNYCFCIWNPSTLWHAQWYVNIHTNNNTRHALMYKIILSPIVLSQNCSSATSWAKLAPINALQLIPRVFAITLDIISNLTEEWLKPWNITWLKIKQLINSWMRCIMGVLNDRCMLHQDFH